MLLSLVAITESPEWAGKASFRCQDLGGICKIMVRSYMKIQPQLLKLTISYSLYFHCMLVCNI